MESFGLVAGNEKEEGLNELDLLPEEVIWRDEGCEVFPSCLDCPLPRCLEDEPRGRQRLRTSARARRMTALWSDGKSVKEIAEIFKVSRRTVQRALATTRNHREHTQ